LVVKEPIPGAKTKIVPYNHLMLKTILNLTVEDQLEYVFAGVIYLNGALPFR